MGRTPAEEIWQTNRDEWQHAVSAFEVVIREGDWYSQECSVVEQ